MIKFDPRSCTRLVVALAIACAISVSVMGPLLANSGTLPRETVVVQTSRGIFAIETEIADTPESRARGLQHRNSLDAHAGMLFDFQVSRRVAMWMKNTPISLDMVFLDCAGRVLNVATGTEPYSLAPIRSAGPALAVLEVVAGTAERLGIDRNSMVRHRIFEPSVKTCPAVG